MREMLNPYQKTKAQIYKLIGSNVFFSIICGIVFLQAAWYALSFQPIIFDEGRHFGFISRYTDQLSPFISKQPTSWDSLGETTRDPSYLYYYVMSFPLRVVKPILTETPQQIIFLRFINVALTIVGFYFFRKVFDLLKVDRRVSHLGLLLFALLPTVALYPGVVHYDNAIFLLYAILLWLSLRAVKASTVPVGTLSAIAIICMLGSLVKFQFIALFLPVIAYLLWHYLKMDKSRLAKGALKSWKSLSVLAKVFLPVALVGSLGLFAERSVVNIAQYGQIQPDCQKVMSEERCLKNFTTQRNLTLIESKPSDFSPTDPYDYTLKTLLPSMLVSQSTPIAGKGNVKFLDMLVYSFFFAALFMIIYNLRSLMKSSTRRLALVAMAGYSFLLATYLYVEYVKYGAVVATSGRYLYQILPLFIVIGLSALCYVRVVRRLALTLTILSLLAFSQGGSILTQLTNGSQDFYWKSSFVRQTNSALASAANKLIIGRLR